MKKRRTMLRMWRSGCAILAVSVVLVGCGGPSGPSLPVRTAVASPDHATAIDSARSHLRRAAERGVGLAAAVTDRGRLVWLEGVGYADLERRTPVNPARTRFRIYSVSKPMTAVAAARLMETGRLDPRAPVQDYVPGFQASDDLITPMHLATHTSGIRHYRGDAEANSMRHCDAVDEALPIFMDDPLVHAPGEGETYSSWGFVLLSAVVGAAGGADFPSVMEETLFRPAGMTRTVVDDPTLDVEGRASFYEETEGTVEAARAVDNTCKWGAGGYLSTAEDVVRFGAAMLDDEILSAESRELFMRGEDVYRAQGIGTGGAAFLTVDRERSLSVALLSNVVGGTAGPAARAAAERIHQIFRGTR